MTDRYVKNEFGGIHAVTEAHFNGLHLITPNGTKVLQPGWSEVTEDDARAAHPQLFGAWDPDVRLNARERKDAQALAEFDLYDDEPEERPRRRSRAAKPDTEE